MSRINYLPRTGMYEAAYEHIKQLNPLVDLPNFEEVEKTRKYDPKRGTTSPEWEALCSVINDWLNEHYDMFFLDVTNFGDTGSRDEVVLCYTKRTEEFDHPDFETELPKAVFWR